MGLTSGAKGAKQVFQEIAPVAFSRSPGLSEITRGLGDDRSAMAVIIDGNVALRQVPQSAATLNDFVFFFYRSLFSAASAAETVVVVFDEPAATTRAKEAEQRRRDLARKGITTPVANDVLAVTDEYDVAFLENHSAVASLLNNRVARSRFIDEVVFRAATRIQQDVVRWNQQNHVTRIIFDGVDPAGAKRPVNTPRVACILGNTAIVSLLARSRPIGEGDLKMVDVAAKIHGAVHNDHPEVHKIKYVLHTTIDTDALPISLIHEEKMNRLYANRRVRDVICFREQAKKRISEDDVAARASYLLCDVSLLGQQLRASAFSSRCVDGEVTMATRERLMVLVAIAAAISGCDFVKVSGANFDAALEAVFRMIRGNCSVDLSVLRDVASKDTEDVLGWQDVIKELCHTLGGVLAERPRMTKQTINVREVDSCGLMRTAWVASYWSTRELPVEAFGFLPESA